MTHGKAPSGRTPPEGLHTPYITEVVRSLLTLGLSVADDEATVLAGPPRFASIPIEADVIGGRWRDAEWMLLAWDERSGWSWQVKLVHEPSPRDAVYFGVALLPEPGQIATWASTLLVHRGLRLARRPHKPHFAGPDLDTALAAYDGLAGAAREVSIAVRASDEM
ncbi:DUF6292 family protein [Saccharothrix sp.]|uniref:DUF6292 family protein n=1 Tax=Saccharothrix sp. TaxID=1873460 RepID=UPI002810E457|nr:DUF6292 family protein [Saccharothrix sp.]